MAKRRRLYAAGIPCHIVHRGLNRQMVFLEIADRARYLDRLDVCARRHAVDIHAYVLMGNHVYLLATPREDGGVSRLMRDLGSHWVPRTNATRGRSGTLWEGRHYSAVISSDRYFLACSRYIELNPVRAGMVRHPGAFRWSSHRSNAMGTPDPVVSPHPLYEALGHDDVSRRRNYASLFDPVAMEGTTVVYETTHFRSTLRRAVRIRR